MNTIKKDEFKNGYIGIDLGTTNSCIATSYYLKNGAVQVDILDITQKGINQTYRNKTLPSYIYVEKNSDKIIGLGAKEKDNFTRNLSNGENRALRVFKRDMGLENVVYNIKNDKNEKFTPVIASSLILKECGLAYNIAMKNRDTLKYFETPTTITCPACFEKDAREDTLKAAKAAGFDLNNVRMIAEPNAALLSYVHKEYQRGFLDLKDTKRFLTIDLGGGTCDVVIIDVLEETLESGKSNLIFRPIGTPNRGDLGGSDFDRAIARGFVAYFLGTNNINLDTSSKEYSDLINFMFVWAEKAKEELSKRIEDIIRNDPLGRDIYDTKFIKDAILSVQPYDINLKNVYENKDFVYSLSLEEYLKIVDNLIFKKTKKYTTIEEKIANKNLEEIIFDTMKNCNCNKDDIDYVFFTGGMSMFIPLQEKLYTLLGKIIKLSDNPLTAVAEGAALYTLFKEAEKYNKDLPAITAEEYHLTTNTVEKALRTNKQNVSMPTSIGKTYMIERKGQLPFVLIEKNKEYPIPRTRIESLFKIQNYNGVIINIFIGTSKYNSDIEMARSLKIRFENPKQIDTEFNIDYEINDSGSPIFYVVFDENEEYKIGGVEND